MSDYIFYTPQDLASLLIDLVSKEHTISTVIDICCGSWNLLNAAKQKYPNAQFVGVDVDESSAFHQIANSEFICCDGRAYSENQFEKNRYFDLILSNPPFGTLETSEKLYSIKGNVFAESKRYEAEMLWANYRLMSTNSTLIIILPSTYVDGSTYINYRRWLAKNCYVQKIVRLPQNTFSKAKLNTVALILKKKSTTQSSVGCEIFQASYDSAWNIHPVGKLTSTDIDNGLWSNLCISTQDKSSIAIFRGNISSKFFKEGGELILHCSSLFCRNHWRPGVRTCDGIVSSQRKYVKRGDIIVNRIGRSAGYWCVYNGKKALVSDCLIVIPSPTPAVVSRLNTISTNGRLSIPLRGISTQYITMEDIVNQIVSSQ